MIYELRTYTLKPGGVPEFEARFEEVLPYREKYSKLAGFWHTEIGPLNQVVHLWAYEDLRHRTEARAAAAQDPHLPPKVEHLFVGAEAEVLIPAPFMRPLEPRQMGSIYEMRIYTYQHRTIPEVLKRWEAAIAFREQFSPLAGCWYTELGGLDKLIHLWPYADFAERERVRRESRQEGRWPPATREFLVRQENKLLIPAPFSPLR